MTELTYRLLRADEADDLVEFVRSIYGDSYPSDIFCDAGAIRSAIASKRLFCGVAIDVGGRIVGHLATQLDRPGEVTGDGITGMVAPEARGQSVVSRLAGPLFAVHEEHGIVGLHLYPVTNHDITQRRIADNGGVVTGLLLYDWPADVSMAGFSTEGLHGRMPMLMMYCPLGRLPKRAVHLPAVYADTLGSIYEQLSLAGQSRIVGGADPSIDVGTSRVEEIVKRRQGTRGLRFHQIGDDWSARLDDAQSRLDATPAQYVDVTLSSQRSGAVVDSLREQSWFFGGLILERAGTDFVRMQRGGDPPSSTDLRLCESGQVMHDFVIADRSKVGVGQA